MTAALDSEYQSPGNLRVVGLDDVGGFGTVRISLPSRSPEFSTPDTIPASNALPSSINSSTLSESTLSTLDKPSRSPDCSHEDFLRNAEDPSFWVAFGFFLLISLVDLRLSP